MGFAPLHLAVMRKDIQKTKALLRHHALVDIRTGPYSQTGENSQTPLHIAAASGCSTLASVLLLHGAHINERASNSGLTPLHYAAYRAENPSEVIKLLLEMGANPNLKDSQGWTALHFLGTSFRGHSERVAYLSSLQIAGVDPDRPTLNGNSPIDVMESRALNSKVPGDRTHHGAFAFCALIVEIRWRNWDAGLFLHNRDKFFQEGRRQRVYRWLGWKWQQLRDQPHLAEEKWGGSWEEGYFPLNDREDVESVESFCIDGLFEEEVEGEGMCPVVDMLEGDGDTSGEDEFFDVEG